MQVERLIGRERRLVVFVLGVETDNGRPLPQVAPQTLRLAAFVVGDHRVGGGENGLRGPVVLLQHHHFGLREVPLKGVYVADVGPSEPVNGLVGVPHRAQVAMPGGQAFHQLVLGVIGVLKFVHMQVTETFLIAGQNLGNGVKQVDGHHQQVVEIHGGGLRQPLLVHLVDFGDALPVQVAGVFGLDGERLEVDQFVFSVGDGVFDVAGGVTLLVHVQFADGALHRPAGIQFIVDGEGGVVTEVAGLPAQDADAGGMKGGHPHVPGRPAYQPLHPLGHLPRRLVGESDGQHLPGLRIQVAEQVGHPVGEHPRLARTGPGHHQHRPLHGGHRLPLGAVQVVKQRRIRRIAHLRSRIRSGGRRSEQRHNSHSTTSPATRITPL